MSGIDATTSFATAFADELVRSGVTVAVVSPGSRNTPLALAFAREPGLRVDVVLDERSAGFRALGYGLATGVPAVVCCTSGTAAANLHPAVVEADYARVPLLVCTADRPPELRDWGAGQTIDQTKLFGDAVRWFHDPGPPEETDDAPARWRALACRAVAVASGAFGASAGPVHLNLPFREPLVPSGAPLLAAPGRADGAPWTRVNASRRAPGPHDVEALTALVRAHPRGLLVAGWGARLDPAVADAFVRAAGWPVLADPLSGLRCGPRAVSTYEALARAPRFAAAHRPDLVVRVGAPLTSKAANAWLDDVPAVLVDPDGAWLDPARTASHLVPADAGLTLAAVTNALPRASDDTWFASWSAAEHGARAALDAVLDEDVACEARIARDLAAAVPDGGALVVASSVPVRALEWAMAPRTGVRVFANRGANGIDGFVSTARGIAGAHARPTFALCGDLCFLHDTNGLLGAAADNSPLTIVVVDNRGGAIFSYLAQRDLPPAEFETLFATPQDVDLVAVARAHGVAAETVDPSAPAARIAEAPAGTRVLVVPVDGDAARKQHARLWDAVASSLD